MRQLGNPSHQNLSKAIKTGGIRSGRSGVGCARLERGTKACLNFQQQFSAGVPLLPSSGVSGTKEGCFRVLHSWQLVPGARDIKAFQRSGRSPI